LAALRAVTVMLRGTPAVPVPGALTEKWVVALVATATALDMPVMVPVTVSVAVMVWVPGVCKVTESVAVPAVSVVLAGRVALPSVEVKCTVPA